ncbi:unnamed protein product [Symbiodinium necroappetens]|uniref:Uncharacterized protein n=1 Tax=Symbiodinium necroappetens TaxID=1628268 RepID=A0A812UHE3_9DINO|nr:unnamed protein product [Symbiodinium necroappetens]
MWGRVAICIGCIGVALLTLLSPWQRRFSWAPAGSALADSGNATPAAQTDTRPPCQFCPPVDALHVWKSSDLSVRADLEVLWPANGTLEVSVDKEVQALVVAQSLKSLYASPFVFAWIRSSDDSLLAAEAGVPVLVKFGRRSRMIEKWLLSFSLKDPGHYTVTFLAVVPSPEANISDPRAFKIQLVGSPQTLKVSEGGGGDGEATAVRDLPLRACELGTDELMGRWVRSLSDGNSSCGYLGCPRDGWTFVSENCYWKAYNPEEALSIAETLRFLERSFRFCSQY